jgi:ATP-dependent RNA helicase DDX5/DBP2
MGSSSKQARTAEASDSEEERRQRKARKAAKQREEEDEDAAADAKSEKKAKKEKKKRRDSEDASSEEDRKPSKKRKLEASASPVAPAAASALAVPVVGRMRTRSMSDAEDVALGALNPDEYRRNHTITIVGRSKDGGDRYSCPAPMTTFSSTPFSAQIRRALEAAGFPHPTPTQAQCWPIALEGRDVITVAKTGSGKTIGFLLPAFHRLAKEFEEGRRRGAPAILVLAPTRELAVQIEVECIKFGRTSNIRSACCYGGSPKSLQLRKLQNGVEVIIATPGRLNDFIEMKAVDLSKISFLVLDEADRMLDM